MLKKSRTMAMFEKWTEEKRRFATDLALPSRLSKRASQAEALTPECFSWWPFLAMYSHGRFQHFLLTSDALSECYGVTLVVRRASNI